MFPPSQKTSLYESNMPSLCEMLLCVLFAEHEAHDWATSPKAFSLNDSIHAYTRTFESWIAWVLILVVYFCPYSNKDRKQRSRQRRFTLSRSCSQLIDFHVWLEECHWYVGLLKAAVTTPEIFCSAPLFLQLLWGCFRRKEIHGDAKQTCITSCSKCFCFNRGTLTSPVCWSS